MIVDGLGEDVEMTFLRSRGGGTRVEGLVFGGVCSSSVVVSWWEMPFL